MLQEERKDEVRKEEVRWQKEARKGEKSRGAGKTGWGGRSWKLAFSGPTLWGAHGPFEPQFIRAFLFSSHLCDPVEALPDSQSGRIPSFSIQAQLYISQL